MKRRNKNSKNYNILAVCFAMLVSAGLYFSSAILNDNYRSDSTVNTSPNETSEPVQSKDNAIHLLYENRQSNVQVTDSGIVERILSDDNDGSRHQRFIVRLSSGQTILISHNIDIAPRVNSLSNNDRITFNGEYEWNSQGGVVHWTHKDPNGRHENGSLIHNGRTYQ